MDTDASPAEAVVLAARLRDWLLDEQVVSPALVECVPDGGLGHPPGRGHRAVLAREAGRVRADGTNGVEIDTGRQVVFPPRSTPVPRCPRCGTAAPGEDFADAVQGWYDGDDTAAVRCAGCGEASPVTAWDVDPAWGFGHLSVTFWNWPALSPRFLSALADRLGHRTVVVTGTRAG